MQTRDGIVDAIGNTPLITLKRASAATGCTILGKAEFMKSRSVGEGPPGAPDHPRGGSARRDQAGRPGGREHGRQHRHRACSGRQRARLSHRDRDSGTQSQEKKDMLRLCGAELVEVPAVPYANPNNYQHVGRRLAQESRQKEPNGVLTQINGTISTTSRRTMFRLARKSGRRRRARSTDLSARSEPAERSPALDLSEGEEARRRDRRRRSERRGDVQPVHAWRSQGDGRRLHYRGHRSRPRDADRRANESRQGVSYSRRGGRADHLRSARA